MKIGFNSAWSPSLPQSIHFKGEREQVIIPRSLLTDLEDAVRKTPRSRSNKAFKKAFQSLQANLEEYKLFRSIREKLYPPDHSEASESETESLYSIRIKKQDVDNPSGSTANTPTKTPKKRDRTVQNERDRERILDPRDLSGKRTIGRSHLRKINKDRTAEYEQDNAKVLTDPDNPDGPKVSKKQLRSRRNKADAKKKGKVSVQKPDPLDLTGTEMVSQRTYSRRMNAIRKAMQESGAQSSIAEWVKSTQNQNTGYGAPYGMGSSSNVSGFGELHIDNSSASGLRDLTPSPRPNSRDSNPFLLDPRLRSGSN